MESRPGLRAFLDSNVLFSGAYTDAGPPGRLVDLAALGAFQLVVSRTVLDEVVRNLQRKAPGALPRLGRILIMAALEVAPEASEAEIDRLEEAGFGSDAPIVAAALAADVDYFCTGDQRLLARAAAIQELHAVSPTALVGIMEAAAT